MSGRNPQAERGFSLIEVMVALVVSAIGMLGLAKMASLGIASTTVSSMRSLVALEAAGMAATMHANRAYWGSTSATAGAQITGSTATITDSTLASGVTCYNTISTPCSPTAVAGYDVRTWGQALANLMQGTYYTANIACLPTATPVTCTITVTWVETAVAVNTQQTGITQGNFTATQQPTYTLYVQP